MSDESVPVDVKAPEVVDAKVISFADAAKGIAKPTFVPDKPKQPSREKVSASHTGDEHCYHCLSQELSSRLWEIAVALESVNWIINAKAETQEAEESKANLIENLLAQIERRAWESSGILMMHEDAEENDD